MLPRMWDYSHTNPKGKNVFIFADTSHISEDIHNTLLDELEVMTSRGFFSTIYCEGSQGEYISQFPTSYTESDLKSALKRERGKWGCIELFSHRHRKKILDGKLIVLGVDNESILCEQLRRAKRIIELGDKNTVGVLTKEECLELDYLLGPGFDNFTHARSGSSVESILKDMTERTIQTAGLVYGNSHLELMMQLLKEKGIGYASYFPGQTERSAEQGRKYIERLCSHL